LQSQHTAVSLVCLSQLTILVQVSSIRSRCPAGSAPSATQRRLRRHPSHQRRGTAHDTPFNRGVQSGWGVQQARPESCQDARGEASEVTGGFSTWSGDLRHLGATPVFRISVWSRSKRKVGVPGRRRTLSPVLAPTWPTGGLADDTAYDDDGDELWCRILAPSWQAGRQSRILAPSRQAGRRPSVLAPSGQAGKGSDKSCTN
jgi:hypothetical protein